MISLLFFFFLIKQCHELVIRKLSTYLAMQKWWSQCPTSVALLMHPLSLQHISSHLFSISKSSPSTPSKKLKQSKTKKNRKTEENHHIGREKKEPKSNKNFRNCSTWDRPASTSRRAFNLASAFSIHKMCALGSAVK